MENDMSDKIILVTGASRSGISFVASIIEVCGASGGRTARSMRPDHRGSMENIDIRESMIKPFLRGIRADPNAQHPPDIKKCGDVAEKIKGWWSSKVHSILDDRSDDSSFFVAGSQICLMWPIWAAAFPDARWVLVRRSDEGIINSCMMTGFMDAHKTADGWREWLSEYKSRFEEMVDQGINLWQIWPYRVIRGDLRGAKDMIEHVGLRWDPAAVRNLIAPTLWKGGVFEVRA